MAQAAGEQITWTGTFTEAFQRALDVVGLLNGELIDADPGHGTISARTGPFNLGPVISIKMNTLDGTTYVHVDAQSASAILDWGASERLVHRFMQNWESLPLAGE